MDCDGEGAMSTIVTGLEWILGHLELPAVVLMSIGGDATLLLDQACEALVNAGATVVVAAGNDDEGIAVDISFVCMWQSVYVQMPPLVLLV